MDEISSSFFQYTILYLLFARIFAKIWSKVDQKFVSHLIFMHQGWDILQAY